MKLLDYLKGKVCKGFTPRPIYNRAGNLISYFARDDRAYEQQVDGRLTLLRSMVTGEVVGVKLALDGLKP